MTFTRRENFESFDSADHNSAASANLQSTANGRKILFFADKLRVPRLDDYIQRPRLDRLLKKSLDQVGALLLTGRAGTGKTALAAHFAQKYERTNWYRVEAADSDWKVFSSYLFAGVSENAPAISERTITDFVETLLGETEQRSDKPVLLVLDDIHNVFDTDWFDEFFLALLHSLSFKTHLICLSRSLPAIPLWRLRSKQVLSVLDEKVMTFDENEVEEFCRNAGIPVAGAARLYAESFGRIGKLKTLTETA